MPWDYTKTAYDAQAEHDPRWRLERLITHGLRGEKLKQSELEKYLPELNIPDDRRAFLELLVWGKKF